MKTITKIAIGLGVAVAGIGALLYWLSTQVKAEEIVYLPGEIVYLPGELPIYKYNLRSGENYVSLPDTFHISNIGGTNTSRALRQSIIDAGGDNVTVARWNQITGVWDTQTAIGTKFVLEAGVGYKIYLTNSITWVCPTV